MASLPPTSITESYEPATPLKAERTSVKATYLNLETLSQLATRLPLAPRSASCWTTWRRAEN
jgi:hypothetical protein